jgi:capsular exopolysaccharide synthesis family protein
MMESQSEKTGAERTGTNDPSGMLLSEEAFQYYRGLIGQIEIALPQHSSRILLLSSSVNGEGTTEVVIGLGLMLAATMGRQTAIVDCNTDHPDIHSRFGARDVGLGELLNARLTLEEALVNTTVPNLYILPLGSGLSSLAAHSRDAFAGLMSALRSRFDYVLVDVAAIGMNPESTLLCDRVDAVILVVRHGSTRREVVRRTKEIVERAGGRILGVVLNRRNFPIPEFLYRRL